LVDILEGWGKYLKGDPFKFIPCSHIKNIK
jgi:hypothetical protein